MTYAYIWCCPPGEICNLGLFNPHVLANTFPTSIRFYVVSYFSKTDLLVGNLNLYLTNENEKIAIEAMGATNYFFKFSPKNCEFFLKTIFS